MSEDALDRPRVWRPMGRKEKQSWAQKKRMEELVKPSDKFPRAAFLDNPELLPKKPPGHQAKE